MEFLLKLMKFQVELSLQFDFVIEDTKIKNKINGQQHLSKFLFKNKEFTNFID